MELKSKATVAFVSLLFLTNSFCQEQQDKSYYTKKSNQLRNQKKYDEAIALLKRALFLYPNQVGFLFDLGHCATITGRVDDALAAYKQLVTLKPNNANILHNIGYVLKMKGDVESAIYFYQQALQINPDSKSSRYAIALAQLSKGDFQAGWKEYERQQLHTVNFNSDEIRAWIQQDQLTGKRIVIHYQGGFGDTMHFIRYAQELKKLGAHVIVKTKKQLTKLLQLCPYIDEILVGAIPVHFDGQTSVMALPALFNSTEETIPKSIPYLFADKNLTKKWKQFFEATEQKKLKVGLCWTADIKNDECRPPAGNRSIPLELLETLKKCKGVEFYSLQKETPDVCSILPHGPKIKTFGPDFDKTHGAFMDTAAVMQHLDLVVTVDTSIAHLAGGLGIPVWVLLPYSVDWRWIMGRNDSPWYPTMRIFKQEKPMNWNPVLQQVVAALSGQVKQKKLNNANKLLCEGNTLYGQHKIEQALEKYQHASDIIPNNTSVLHNIGHALAELNRPHEAICAYERALAINSNNPGTQFALATAYLATGKYQRGWQQYEWRWKKPGNNLQDLPYPVWDGSDLHGKTVLLRSEGALGDSIQFARYAQLVKQRGATVIVQTLAPLKKLFSLCGYIDEVICAGDPLLHVDYQISLMSLPHIFDTRVDTVPTNIPYLQADAQLQKEWKQAFDSSQINVGICWQADLHNDAQRPPLARRSIPVEIFAPLADIPGIRLFSLQRGDDESLARVTFELYGFGPDFDETYGRFMDTAAVIKNLDLVISVDTSIAHLAGALGTPTWVILPFKSDWRWMVRRLDTPWYPHMTLFRNGKTVDWYEVMEKVAKKLEKRVIEKK